MRDRIVFDYAKNSPSRILGSATSMNRIFKRGIAMALNPPKDPLVAIIGATGTGKSKVLKSLFCKAHSLTAADS
jgi:hypothetical protein